LIEIVTAAADLAAAQAAGLVEPQDTALLFQDFDVLADRLDSLRVAFPNSVMHATAIKTNPHSAILAFLAGRGAGLEAASFEELERASDAGIDPARLVFDSPVKTRPEISACAERWPGMIANANSLAELDRYEDTPNLRVGLRVNPLASHNSPALFDVSRATSKFGTPLSDRRGIVEAARAGRISGLHVHCGSEVQDIETHARSIAQVVALGDEINAGRDLPVIEWIDIGGGLSWQAGDEGMRELAAAITRVGNAPFDRFGGITEFGQWTHAPAGWVASRVEYVDQRRDRADIAFLHVGADLFLRDVYTSRRSYRFAVLDERLVPKGGNSAPVDLVGPLCFAGDVLAEGVALPPIEPGDWLLILDAGANTYGLWSRHCSRRLPRCVAVEGRVPHEISPRTSIHY